MHMYIMIIEIEFCILIILNCKTNEYKLYENKLIQNHTDASKTAFLSFGQMYYFGLISVLQSAAMLQDYE